MYPVSQGLTNSKSCWGPVEPWWVKGSEVLVGMWWTVQSRCQGQAATSLHHLIIARWVHGRRVARLLEYLEKVRSLYVCVCVTHLHEISILKCCI